MKAGPCQEITITEDSLPFPLGKNKNKVIYRLSCFLTKARNSPCRVS